MKVGKSVKIVILLLLMFITAYPTFLALATVQFLIWWYLTYGGKGGLEMETSGYYLLPITFLSAVVFFVSLAMLIKTIRSK
jgi:hypothetical protein